MANEEKWEPRVGERCWCVHAGHVWFRGYIEGGKCVVELCYVLGPNNLFLKDLSALSTLRPLAPPVE